MNARAFSYYDRLRRVKRFIDEYPSERITLGDAARIAGTEKKYFSAFFRAKTGVGFKTWITHLRIRRAVKLMKTRNLSITNLSFAVGYQNLRTFERSFKRCTGMTPQEYKRFTRP